MAGAPVSRPTTVKQTISNPVVPFRTSNERVATLDVSAKTKTGTVVAELVVSANTTARLLQMSRAFQRIRFSSATLSVTAKGASSTSGGYLVAYVADVFDEPTIETLGSFQNAQTKKWWEDTSITVSLPPTLFYTDPKSDTDRWWSPGKFVLMVDGQPSNDISLTLHASISVQLSIPALETDVQETSYVTRENIRFKLDTSQLVEADRTGDGNVRSLVAPEPPNGIVFRVPPYQMEYSEGSGDTGTIMFEFVIVRSGALWACLDGKSAYSGRKTWQNGVVETDGIPWMVIPKGISLETWGQRKRLFRALRSEFVDQGFRRRVEATSVTSTLGNFEFL